MDYESMIRKPKVNLDGCVLSPKDQERVMKETFAPDPKSDEIYKDFDFDGAPPKKD